jgi:hypothetical protein
MALDDPTAGMGVESTLLIIIAALVTLVILSRTRETAFTALR